MNQEKNYLTPNQVAELMMVAPVTVRSWAAKGWLRAVTTPGGHRRFLRKDLEQFARERGMRLRDQTARILIVDDDRMTTDYLCMVLSGCGIPLEIDTAHDGFEAGLKVVTFNPDVVLLDLLMPGMDGFEVCRRIKADRATQDIRVYAMTGAPTAENRQRILEAGAELMFAKPVNQADLLADLGLAPVPATT